MTGLHMNGIADFSISFLIKSYELALLFFSFWQAASISFYVIS